MGDVRAIVDQAIRLDAARRALDAEIQRVSARMGKRARLRARERMALLNETCGRVILLAAAQAVTATAPADPLEAWVAITAIAMQSGAVSHQDMVEAFNGLAEALPSGGR